MGALPGVTRRIAGAEVALPTGGTRKPGAPASISLLDTPGIMVPRVEDPHVGMKLALCGLVRDDTVPPDILADYLLFKLNHLQHTEQYMRLCNLPHPCDSIDDVLLRLCEPYPRAPCFSMYLVLRHSHECIAVASHRTGEQARENGGLG